MGNIIGTVGQLFAGAYWLVLTAGLTWTTAINTRVMPFLIPVIIKAA
jgi:biotin transport system substrate-specific component